MKILETMKKSREDNKGFTLVELIVVLVILAILAAIMVPALLGYIDRAKESQYVLNAKSALTAAQAELSSMYGSDADPGDIAGTVASGATTTTLSTHGNKIITTADVPVDELVIGTKGVYGATGTGTNPHDAYTVAYVRYVENGYVLIYENGSWITYTPGTSNIPAAPTTANKYYKVK